MFLSGKHLSRRRALQGMGAVVGLPFLDAMAPAQTALHKTAAQPRPRLACIEMVHGAAGSTPEGAAKHFWSPQRNGANFDFSYSLEPLEPWREYLTIVSGTDARQAEAQAPTEGGADHFRSSAVYLTAAHARQTAGPDIANGTSIDQMAARKLGGETRVPSIELCIENVGLSESCGFNYSCIYSETISWASPTQPVEMTVNPRVAFQKLFGDQKLFGGQKLFGHGGQGSVLDGVTEDVRRLQSELGPADRARLNSHLEEIRAVERHIQAIELHNANAAERDRVAAPLGVPDSWEEHAKLMFDLQVLAFASDVTRVSAFKMSRDTNNRIFPGSGVKTPFHSLSHHGERPELIEEFAKLNRYHVSLLPYFLGKLKNTPDGDGNLLDHSLVLYGSPMGDSNTHNHRNLPILIAGHACGQLKGNLHYIAAEGTPHANTLLTILHKLGVEEEKIADSSGLLEI